MRKLFTILGLLSVASSAFANTITPAKAGPMGSLGTFLPLIIIVVIFYFLLIRPQMKRTKEHRNLLGQLQVGDEVVTSSGILGKIANVGDAFIELTIADKTTIKVQKQAIGNVMPKGTV